MMKMFALVHVGERAGSGIPNMVKNWTDAGYGRPVLSEQVNPKRSTIFLPLPQVSAAKKRQKKRQKRVWNVAGEEKGNPRVFDGRSGKIS